MPDAIIVRLADKSDAAAIAAISRQTFYDTFVADNSPENMQLFMEGVFNETALMAEVGAEGNLFLLAFAGESLAGYARLHETQNPAGLGHAPAIELARLYSKQSMIGKGVGKALMQACIDAARAAGKQILWLGVWEHNRRAIDFYHRWGFERFSEHDFILGKDVQTDWLMKRVL